MQNQKKNMGKLHGGLAKVGKVKNQTPNVSLSENKKKSLTGRAKKRQQYNRRFGTLSIKNIGPNSNKL